ncbi:CRTAC1 family protein [Thiorhodococcus minor]|uniref:CRTAC1 family protein n=1 Tax=Thiorhodococcus minor TaxID=57489 RepID=A0A6M0K1A9_9GAMM|nr:CRTAC1 family protein [Thiorhodococcus minor]NEV62683.1 CRTAC1 family protein [Thiorhodococcus minor]
MTPSSKSSISRGEARIRRAFILSSAVIASAALLAGAAYLLLSRAPEREPVEEARIETPIPAPAPSEPPDVRFTDITAAAGIDFVHVSGAYGERLMPETIGSGAAFFDYDRDGDQDLLLVNSRRWAGHLEGKPQPTQALYANDGTGHFADVTEQAGLALVAYGMGVAIGDYDDDGWEDVYLTTLETNHLLRNDQGHFEDVTGQAAVGGADTWSSSAAFLDYDKDGDLDLFVVNYVKWSRETDLAIDFRLTGLGRAYGAPVNFVGTDNRLYRNEGNGRFTDVTETSGIRVTDPVSSNPVGKGLGVVPVDYDQDGWLDLVVVNDTVRNFLFRNLGNGSFEEVGVFEGIAYDRNGKATSAMGVDAAHFRDDQDVGIAIGNFANEMASLFVTADGRTPLVDEAVLEGMGPASRIPLTFGVVFLDYDLDGRLDLLLANGHLEHEINKVQQSQHYAQPPLLFWNCGHACPGRFLAVTDAGDLMAPMVGRGVSYADIDGDGDLDLLITQNGRRPALLRNDQRSGHHWLRVKLVGRAPNTDALGARLELTVDGVTRIRDLVSARGYLSAVEPVVTFGLGAADHVERLRITWPEGQVQELMSPRVDTLVTVEQPQVAMPDQSGEGS